LAARVAKERAPLADFWSFIGADFPLMLSNQVRNPAERRIPAP
jgi:hypothetical protein